MLLTQQAWIFSKHSIKETQTFHFMGNRANTTAMAEKKLSVFIHRDIVVPVVNATILLPDKIVYSLDQNTHYLEKLFDTEIGHGVEGCHYVSRIVTRVDPVSGTTQLVTAYTLPRFTPSFSNYYFQDYNNQQPFYVLCRPVLSLRKDERTNYNQSFYLR